MFLFFFLWDSWHMSWSFFGIFIKSRVNQLCWGSIFSGSPLCELHCTITVQFGGILPYLMNGNLENSLSNTNEIEVRRDQFLGLEPKLLILYDILNGQYIYLHVSRVPTCVLKLYCFQSFIQEIN